MSHWFEEIYRKHFIWIDGSLASENVCIKMTFYISFSSGYEAAFSSSTIKVIVWYRINNWRTMRVPSALALLVSHKRFFSETRDLSPQIFMWLPFIFQFLHYPTEICFCTPFVAYDRNGLDLLVLSRNENPQDILTHYC